MGCKRGKKGICGFRKEIQLHEQQRTQCLDHEQNGSIGISGLCLNLWILGPKHKHSSIHLLQNKNYKKPKFDRCEENMTQG